jgi:hypothetical protein
MGMDGGRIACEFEGSKQRRPRFFSKRSGGIVIEIDALFRHLPSFGLRARHTFHVRIGTPEHPANQTLLEICRPTSLQGALNKAACGLKPNFEPF